MWISRKEFEKLQRDITLLKNWVQVYGATKVDIDGKFLEYIRSYHITTNTENINNLSFDELAAYVIDGKPIIRKEDTVVFPRNED